MKGPPGPTRTSTGRNGTGNLSFSGPLALLGASAVWGGMYSVMKVALATVPALVLICLEYALATAVLIPFAGPALVRTRPRLLVKAAGMGLLWFASVSLVFLGLRTTSPGLSAFIVVQTAVVTPLLVGLTGGGWFDRKLGGAIVLVLAGMAVIFLPRERPAYSAATLLIGLAVVLLSAHMMVLGRLTHQVRALVLVLVQVGVTASAALAASLVFQTWPEVPRGFGPPALVAILYGGLGSSLLGFLLQTLGQRHTPISHVGLFLSLESVFAVLISATLGVERVSFSMLAGFGLVFAGTLLARAGVRTPAPPPDEPLELAPPL